MKKRFYFMPTLFALMVSFWSCEKTPYVAPPGGGFSNDPELEDNTHLRSLAATEVAPNMTKVLKEDYNVLIYELIMEPGDTLPYHEHSYHTYYFIEGGTLEIRINDSTTETIEFQTGETGIGAPSGDLAINKGETTIRILMHEFYSLKINQSNSYAVNREEGAFYIAPNMTKVKHDEYGIVVYELIIDPGETLPYHVHPYHSSYIIEGGTLELIVGNASSGNIDEYVEGRLGLGKTLADVAINRGETSVKALLHEIYSLVP